MIIKQWQSHLVLTFLGHSSFCQVADKFAFVGICFIFLVGWIPDGLQKVVHKLLKLILPSSILDGAVHYNNAQTLCHTL